MPLPSDALLQPKVAFLVAVYHKEQPEYLRQSIESMLNQTYQNLDIHIYKDGTLGKELSEVLSSYASAHSNIFLYENPRNRGLAVCLNEMIEQIKDRYDYFARMDSDDVCYSNRIQKQVEFLQSHPAIDVLGGSIIDMNQRGVPLKQVRYPEDHAGIVQFFHKRNPMAHATVVYRRSFFEKAGLYPPVRLEDGLYWMQGLLAGCQFHNIPDFLVSVRRTDDFLKRRSGFKKAWAELMIKLTINRRLKFGWESYCYAIAVFIMQLLPIWIKKILYDALR